MGQLALDRIALATALARRRRTAIHPRARYAAGVVAMALSAIGVNQAVRVPPVEDIAIEVTDLPPAFEGYRILQLADLHVSRLFLEPWTRVPQRDREGQQRQLQRDRQLLQHQVERRLLRADRLVRIAAHHAADLLVCLVGEFRICQSPSHAYDAMQRFEPGFNRPFDSFNLLLNHRP